MMPLSPPPPEHACGTGIHEKWTGPSEARASSTPQAPPQAQTISAARRVPEYQTPETLKATARVSENQTSKTPATHLQEHQTSETLKAASVSGVHISKTQESATTNYEHATEKPPPATSDSSTAKETGHTGHSEQAKLGTPDSYLLLSSLCATRDQVDDCLALFHNINGERKVKGQQSLLLPPAIQAEEQDWLYRTLDGIADDVAERATALEALAPATPTHPTIAALCYGLAARATQGLGWGPTLLVSLVTTASAAAEPTHYPPVLPPTPYKERQYLGHASDNWLAMKAPCHTVHTATGPGPELNDAHLLLPPPPQNSGHNEDTTHGQVNTPAWKMSHLDPRTDGVHTGVHNHHYHMQTELRVEEVIRQLTDEATPTVCANLRNNAPWRVSYRNPLTDGTCNDDCHTQTEQNIKNVILQLMAAAVPRVTTNLMLEGSSHHLDRSTDGIGRCDVEIDKAVDETLRKLVRAAPSIVLTNLEGEIDHLKRRSQKRNLWELKAPNSHYVDTYGNLRPYSTNTGRNKTTQVAVLHSMIWDLTKTISDAVVGAPPLGQLHEATQEEKDDAESLRQLRAWRQTELSAQSSAFRLHIKTKPPPLKQRYYTS